MTTGYNALIADTLKITPERARLVEAYLRLDHGTLDALSPDDITREYFHGGITTAIDANPKGARALADSYGLAGHKSGKRRESDER